MAGGATPRLTTLVPTASPVRRTFQYSRQQVIDSLTAVLERYQPTVVRTLDPNPTHRAQEPHYPNTPPVLQGISHYDHQDHTTSAYFAQAALEQYWGRKHSRPTAVDTYVGYEVALLPNSLDRATTKHKIQLLDIYGWADGKDCGDPAELRRPQGRQPLEGHPLVRQPAPPGDRHPALGAAAARRAARGLRAAGRPGAVLDRDQG
ncbi:hypothetical protein GCM10020000_08380 [Streptomyces olivoverticillatus]